MKTILISIVIAIFCFTKIATAQQLSITILNTTATKDSVFFETSFGTFNYPGMAVLFRTEHGTTNLLDKDTFYLLPTILDTLTFWHKPNSNDTFDYHFCIWNTNGNQGCSNDTSIATIPVSTGGNGPIDVVSPFVVTVSPNPTDYKARITFPEKIVGEKCIVINSMGQKVREFTANESTIFYKEDLPPGIYFILIRNTVKKLVLR